MNKNSIDAGAQKHDFSRRSFLIGSGLALGGLGASAALGGCAPKSQSSASSSASSANCVTEELPIPDAPAPSKTAYDCDVLVIGGGWAGLNAAMAARTAGSSVVLVDKGRPGYSGLAPWPSSHRWFDPAMGDDAQAFKDCIKKGSEFTGNADWFQVWIDQSKTAYERLSGWGLMDRYDRCADTSYWSNLDYQGYRDANLSKDRHKRASELLSENGIELADYTMVTDVVTDAGRVVGAVGFHVPSGTVISVNAKSIVMAMGGGCYKPSGYPVGDNTFDGEYIAYNLGLPIVGKEYDDFHQSASFAPGCSFVINSWDYLENIYLCGGDITADTVDSYAKSKETVMVMGRITGTIDGIKTNDGTSIDDQANGTVTRRGGTAGSNPDDIRVGKMLSPKSKGDIYGAAVGMCAHFSSGVFCGLNDLEGATGIKGLWVAGDGMNGCGVTGSTYPVGVGFTSNFASIQGDIAGKAASAYASSAASASISADKLSELTEQIQAPLNVEAGFSPDWARDELQAIMAPWWVLVSKDATTLEGALSQVIRMRDSVIPKLSASNSHQLRLAIEMKHKVLSAEIKLRASLARTESRGLHYRNDYPYRDDDGFLCYITLTRGSDGSMQVGKVDLPADWVGDKTQDYSKRYQCRFPGEAAAKGLPAEASTSSWG